MPGRELSPKHKTCVFAMLEVKLPVKTIAKALDLAERRVYGYQAAYRRTGNPFPPTGESQNATRLTPAVMASLLDMLRDKPSLYLDEMQWWLVLEKNIYVTPAAISIRLKKAGWSNKKLYHVASQRDEDLRIDWMRKISTYTAEMFVFCDESGLDRRDGARRTGWAPVGVAPFESHTLDRGKRFHILPALTITGLLASLVYEGHTDADGFVLWLEESLLPLMGRFPGPKSILVMDNASWHKDARVEAACLQAGVLLLFLPPYSPDFNPIEAFFKDLKTAVRRCYQYTGGDSISKEEFKRFLMEMADMRGDCIEAIMGHFRQAMVPWRDGWEEDMEVDYLGLYQEEYAQFLNGTLR